MGKEPIEKRDVSMKYLIGRCGSLASPRISILKRAEAKELGCCLSEASEA